VEQLLNIDPSTNGDESRLAVILALQPVYR